MVSTLDWHTGGSLPRIPRATQFLFQPQTYKNILTKSPDSVNPPNSNTVAKGSKNDQSLMNRINENFSLKPDFHSSISLGHIFLKTYISTTLMTKQTFQATNPNTTNRSPVFQPNSNTVIQCPSFTVKPTKM